MRRALACLLLLAGLPAGVEAGKHLTLKNLRTGVVAEIALVERRDCDAVSLAELCRAVGLVYEHDRVVGRAAIQKGSRLVQVVEGTPFVSLSGELRLCYVTPFLRGGAIHVAIEDLPAVLDGLELAEWDWSVRDRDRPEEDPLLTVPPPVVQARPPVETVVADVRRPAPGPVREAERPAVPAGGGKTAAAEPAQVNPGVVGGQAPVQVLGSARSSAEAAKPAAVVPEPPRVLEGAVAESARPVGPNAAGSGVVGPGVGCATDVRTGATPEGGGMLRFVVLDAGHGGHDPGAIGLTGLREKIVVQKVAQMVERKLKERLPHVEVYRTRRGGEFVGLRERVRFANRVVRDRKAGVFVSIHANISRNKQTWGHETYYLSEHASDDEARAVAALENGVLELEGKDERSVVGRVLSSLLDAELIRQSRLLAECVNAGYGAVLPWVPSRGVKTARFFVLEGVMMPAVLTEVGFLSNREEERRLRDDAYLEKLAEGIVEGIVRFSRLYDRYNGFT